MACGAAVQRRTAIGRWSHILQKSKAYINYYTPILLDCQGFCPDFAHVGQKMVILSIKFARHTADIGVMNRKMPHIQKKPPQYVERNTGRGGNFSKKGLQFTGDCGIIPMFLPVAQLDSASDSDSEGRRFESFRVGQTQRAPLLRCPLGLTCSEAEKLLKPRSRRSLFHSLRRGFCFGEAKARFRFLSGRPRKKHLRASAKLAVKLNSLPQWGKVAREA